MEKMRSRVHASILPGTAALLAAALATSAQGQADTAGSAQNAPAPAESIVGPDTTPGTAPGPSTVAPAGLEVQPPPAAADDPFTAALLGGKFDLNVRARYEFADVGNLQTANAYTVRTRLGYTTDFFEGFRASAQLEANLALDNDSYNAAGLNGQPGRAIVADPEDGEANQFWIEYDLAAAGDGGPDASVRLGRQRIVLDDARFVGNVGWRQLEQTFDAVGFTAQPAENLELYYGYVWGVNRIFGDSADRDFQSNSHLINARISDTPLGALTGFGYLLDFDDAAALSSQTYGLRLAGEAPLDDAFSLGYTASAAYQQDYGDNPTDYEAPYFLLELKALHQDGGFVGLGYEELGSDDGVASFQTPLATGHKFNGFADAFLLTPAAGLRDYYVVAGSKLPAPFKGVFSVFYHQFTAADTSQDLGWELDLVASHKFTPNLTGLVKYAFFDGDGGLNDVERFWAQLELSF